MAINLLMSAAPNSPELSLIGGMRLFRAIGHPDCDQNGRAVHQRYIFSITMVLLYLTQHYVSVFVHLSIFLF